MANEWPPLDEKQNLFYYAQTDQGNVDMGFRTIVNGPLEEVCFVCSPQVAREIAHDILAAADEAEAQLPRYPLS